MNSDSNNGGEMRELEDVEDRAPQSKHGDEGKAANEGDQAGPNSARGGEPIAPQTGNPRADDRRPH